jgi:hypothetical protein
MNSARGALVGTWLLVLAWSEFAFPRLAYSALLGDGVPVAMFAAATLVASKALGFADW